MSNKRLVSITRIFGETLDHGLPISFSSDKDCAPLRDAVEVSQFMQSLTELGNDVKLVYMSNSVPQENYASFLEKLSFPILTFYRESENHEWEPIIIRLDKKLQLLAFRMAKDGRVTETMWEDLKGEYYLNADGDVLFMTAFPFRSIVSEAEKNEEHPTPLKRLLNLLGTERRDIVYLYVYAVAVGIISLSLPLGTQAIVGFISGGMWFNSVVLLIALVIVGIVVTGGLQIMQISMVEMMQRRIFTKTAFEFAYRIPKIDAEALLKYYAPELINRFFDVLTLQKGLPKLLIDLLTAVVQIFFSLILLSFYHPFFVFFGLLLVTILVIIFYITGPKGLRSSIVESKYKYKVAYWLEELARTLNSFKVAGTTQLPMKRVSENVDNYLVHRKAHFGVLIKQFALHYRVQNVHRRGLAGARHGAGDRPRNYARPVCGIRNYYCADSRCGREDYSQHGYYL